MSGFFVSRVWGFRGLELGFQGVGFTATRGCRPSRWCGLLVIFYSHI